jgi:hypothetical protein
MANTNRYNGLLFLQSNDLPVPKFQKISTKNDINDELSFDKAPFGWTIRTCKLNGNQEFNLFYKNNISFYEVKEILLDRLDNNKDEFYIIYHSWDFDFSFNIIKDRDKYIIEGDLGSQKGISLGKEIPKFSLIMNSHTLTIQQSLFSTPSFKIKNGILRALRLLRKNVLKDRYYTEVAITKQKQMFFYEFTDISYL